MDWRCERNTRAMLAWIVLGKRTRRMTQNLDVMTMPEFLEARYGSDHLKMISAVMIFVFLLPYSASVFKGLGHLFESTFKVSYDFALIVLVGITGLYLILGGYFAVTLTDFIQGIIMLAGATAMVIVLVYKAGGPAEAVTNVAKNYAEHVPPETRPSLLTIGSLVFMTSFGTWGLPQMVQKFYAIKDEKVIGKATVITTIFSLIIGVAAYSAGSLSHVFFDLESVPRLDSGGINFDLIMPTLLANYLPEFLLAVIMLLVLSASMSSLASMILVSSSAITIDLYKGYLNPDVSEKTSLILIRVLSGVFIICSYAISKMQVGFIVTLMSLSWGVLSGGFMAPYILGIFWKRVTKAGAYAGLFTGAGLAILLFFVLGPENSPLASSIAMIAPFIVVPLVSLVTPKMDGAIIETAFRKPQP
ncbi:sodium:solute symporter family protein [Brucepastera parasyntrophica]|uniref:sodium:solute symporter family protein n=1 Tax=Brucepastera parasyntrophica TaxID=2880008 RepID=UPI00210C7A37|nr:sodium:solute symporter family protein [Brucepastera parasyntrophica]ULQ58882.1 sodium:solute symporter family protein [Brucepastera parasyntrophica]